MPAEHPVVARVRDLLTGEPPASCREVSLRLSLARPFVDAVFAAIMADGQPPQPCDPCGGTGYSSMSPQGGLCKRCRGTGLA